MHAVHVGVETGRVGEPTLKGGDEVLGTRPASSRTDRHRLHRGGDRQLNRALHTIAVTRARIDPETRAYLDRKRAEGKSNREALRCLKRHLARHVHRLLTMPPATPEPRTPHQQNTAISV